MVRGRASEEELAALAVVLWAVWARDEGGEGGGMSGRGRWWRGPEAYRAPRSWQ
ncbi:acyl-CoA carboxylase epsilon subunit [Streptomyces sp. SAS_270]|uniref:acyl-CoA carboxylase epsilon subunit n=1 Tax=Streptomyces sp. SAS_270 TaxID=3412748 RepID=UPI00403C91A6